MEVVYVIGHDRAGPVKIGISKEPTKRRSSLQCGNPQKLDVFYESDVCDALLVEAIVHLRLNDYCAGAGNEWFNVTARHAYTLVNSIAQKFCK